MAHLEHHDDVLIVHDRVDDPVGPLAEPIATRSAGQLLAAPRSRVGGKPPDALNNLTAELPWLDGLDLLCGRGLDPEAIAGHGASVT